jgi:DNA-binding protein H-NS
VKTYRAMLAEIERLQRKAETLRRTELKGVIKHIRELIAQHGLSGADLGLDGAKSAAAPRQFRDLMAALPARGRKAGKAGKAATASLAKGVARYRDPATGKTWTGRGKPPNWIAGAKDRTAFEIGTGAAAADMPPIKAVKASRRAARPVAKKARAAKAAQQPAGKRASAKKAAVKRAAPAQAAKAAKGPKAPKAPKAVKLPKPPTPKAAKASRKKAKAPPAPAPADNGNAGTPATGAE